MTVDLPVRGSAPRSEGGRGALVPSLVPPRTVRTTTKPAAVGVRPGTAVRPVEAHAFGQTGTFVRPTRRRAAEVQRPRSRGGERGRCRCRRWNLPDVAPSGCRGSQGACGPHITRPLTLDAHVSPTPSDVRLTSLAVRPTSAGRSDRPNDRSSAGCPRSRSRRDTFPRAELPRHKKESARPLETEGRSRLPHLGSPGVKTECPRLTGQGGRRVMVRGLR